MARNKFLAEEIDFEGIQRKMAALEPPKLALEEVLTRLRPGMQEQRKRGVTVEQLAQVLKETGIEVGVRNLKNFIEKGELLGGRPRRGSAAAPEREGAGEAGPGERVSAESGAPG